MSDLTKKIKTSGHWSVRVHPARFVAERAPLIQLPDILRNIVVSVRGWDFPNIDPHQPPQFMLDHIEQETVFEHFLEKWRLYQSGQFIALRGFEDDWRDISRLWPPPPNWRKGAELGIGSALFTLYEIFEFSARLANSPLGDESMRIRITIGGLAGRALVVDDPARWGFRRGVPSVAAIPQFPVDRVVSRTELMSDPKALAIGTAQQLFERFGRNVPANVLEDWLGKLRIS